MSQLARKVLDRAKARVELENKILSRTAQIKSLSEPTGDLVKMWDDLETLDPGTSDPEDDLQLAGLKARIKHAQAHQERLAQKIIDGGDHGGLRDGLLVEYEEEIKHLAGVLDRIRAEREEA